MLQKQKCPQDVTSEPPVSAVAHQVLKKYLRLVRQLLRSSAKRSEDEIDYVHQLYVVSRRTLVAIRVFDGALPRTRAGKLRKELLRLRRAAGRAHDLDVIRQRLGDDNTEIDQATASAMIRVNRKRKTAQKRLRRAFEGWKKRRIDHKIKTLLRRTRWRYDCPEPSFSSIIVSQLSVFLRSVFVGRPGRFVSDVCLA